MPSARINNCELNFEQRGDDPPVVFVHDGLPRIEIALQDTASWNWGWELDFAAEFRFVWYDRRGFYRFSFATDGFDLANQALDLELLLDHVEIDSAHVIESSAGGPIATVFAAYRADRVRSSS